MGTTAALYEFYTLNLSLPEPLHAEPYTATQTSSLKRKSYTQRTLNFFPSQVQRQLDEKKVKAMGTTAALYELQTLNPKHPKTLHAEPYTATQTSNPNV